MTDVDKYGLAKYGFMFRVEDLVKSMAGRLSEVEAEPTAAIIFAMEARRLVEMLPTLLQEHQLLLDQVERDVHQCAAHYLSCEYRNDRHHTDHRDPTGTVWSRDARSGSITMSHVF